MKVRELCPQCKSVCKIVDYIWNAETKKYTDKVKKIGFLCESIKFSKKYYRNPNDSLGRGCKLFEKNDMQIKVVHNNRIIQTKKED